MDIVKLDLLPEQNKPNQAKCARLFFAGFSQDGQVLCQLINRHLNSPTVLTTKKVYGPVVAAKPYSSDNFIKEHDCFIISNYLKGQKLQEILDNSEFEVSLIDTKNLTKLIERYESIEVVAWSFGVRVLRALCELLPGFAAKISYAIALNGTIPCVDLNYGIDPKAYDGTLERFNVVMHKQFIKNMCAYAQSLEIGVQNVEPPQDHELSLCSNEDKALVDTVRSLRQLDEFKSELKFMPFIKLAKTYDTNPTHEPISELLPEVIVFDEAYVALGDKIISSAAQYHYWSDYALMRLNVMSLNDNNKIGFTLHTFYGPHLCPALIRDLMLAPIHKRAH